MDHLKLVWMIFRFNEVLLEYMACFLLITVINNTALPLPTTHHTVWHKPPFDHYTPHSVIQTSLCPLHTTLCDTNLHLCTIHHTVWQTSLCPQYTTLCDTNLPLSNTHHTVSDTNLPLSTIHHTMPDTNLSLPTTHQSLILLQISLCLYYSHWILSPHKPNFPYTTHTTL